VGIYPIFIQIRQLAEKDLYNYNINMNDTQNNQKIVCPECDSLINVNSELILGKIVECPACGTESEIINLSPLTLAPLEEEK
jgi:lysine biosynthesis protein LysW